MSRRVCEQSSLRFLSAVFLAAFLVSVRDSRAEIQPTFDMNYCCENAKLIVVGTLRGDRLTVNQVLSSVRMGMATIQLQASQATRLRTAMGKVSDDDIEVVAFLNEKNQSVLGIAGIVGLTRNEVYLVHYGEMMLSERLDPTPYPGLTRAKFLDATKRTIALIKNRRQIAKKPRSAERATMLLGFLDDHAKEADKVLLPVRWTEFHLLHVAKAMSPIHPDEEQVILTALRDTEDHKRLVRLLKLITGVPCTKKAFEPAVKWIAPEHASDIRAAAVRAIACLDNHRAVERIVPMLTFDDPDLPTLLTGLYTRANPSPYWHRNPKAIAALQRLAKESLARYRRGDGLSSHIAYPLLGAVHAYLHPQLLPFLIEVATSRHPAANQAVSYLRHETGLGFDRKNPGRLTDWWTTARGKLVRQYDLSTSAGVDVWLDSFHKADGLSRKMLNRLWLFERSVDEDHLLKRARAVTDAKSSSAKTVLAELWKYGRLSPACKKSIVNAFLDVKLTELDHPGIERGVRELQIVATSRFRFPQDAWVQNSSAFGINRNPSELSDSWGSHSLNSEGDIVFGSMGGGRYLGQPVAKAVLVLREYDHQREEVVWSQKWEFGPLKLKDSRK